MDASRNNDLALLLLRITFGGAMVFGHGWPKLMKLFAEVICAILLVVGLFSRLATIPLIITMLVAIFAIHIYDPFNKLEKAILYLIPYITLLLTGPGRYSLDDILQRNRF